jgi:hypothetical protein
MTRSAKKALQAVPLFQHESLLLGSDVGKTRHVAGFVSKTLLERHQRFEACPALAFATSWEGFAALVERMRELAPLEHSTVLLETTGHSHFSKIRRGPPRLPSASVSRPLMPWPQRAYRRESP